MRPRNNGETILMVCCGEEIECMLEVHRERGRAVAIALWHCDLCFTTFWQPLREIRPDRAQPIIIGDSLDELIETGDETEEEGKQTFRVIKGGKD